MRYLIARPWQQAKTFQRLAAGRFLSRSIVSVVAATATSLHLYGVETIEGKEILVELCDYKVFRRIVDVKCLPLTSAGGAKDAILVLFDDGIVIGLKYFVSRLEMVMNEALLNAFPEDSAKLLAVEGTVVVTASEQGRIVVAEVSVNEQRGSVGFMLVKTSEFKAKLSDSSAYTTVHSICLSRGTRCMAMEKDPPLYLWVTPSDGQFIPVKMGFIISGSGSNRSSTGPGDSTGETSETSSEILRQEDARMPTRGIVTPSMIDQNLSTRDIGGLLASIEFLDNLNEVFYPELTAHDTMYDAETVAGLDPSRTVHAAAKMRLAHHAEEEEDAEIEKVAWENPQWDSPENGKPSLLIASLDGLLYRMSIEDVLRQKVIERVMHKQPVEGLRMRTEEHANVFTQPLDQAEMMDILPFAHVNAKVIDLVALPGGRVVCITDTLEVVLICYCVDINTPLLAPGQASIQCTRIHRLPGAGPLIDACPAPPDSRQSSVLGPQLYGIAQGSPYANFPKHPETSGIHQVFQSYASFVDDPRKYFDSPPLSEAGMELNVVIDEEEEEERNNPQVNQRAYSDPYPVDGSLVGISAFPIPAVLFESDPGVAEGATGVWPLKRSPDHNFHSAVVLSASGGTRILSVDGGVFSDVTDTLAVAVEQETLAAGNVGGAQFYGDWAAQVTATEVRAFQLHGGTRLPGHWHPPAGASIVNARVDKSFVLLQYMRHGEYTLQSLTLSVPEDASLPSEFFEFASIQMEREAACISTLLLHSRAHDDYRWRIALGTHASTVILLEMHRCKVLEEDKMLDIEQTGDVSGDQMATDEMLPTEPRSAAKEEAPEESEYMLTVLAEFPMPDPAPSSIEATPGEASQWQPGSPLAAARGAQCTTRGGALPTSIVFVPTVAGEGIMMVSSREGDVHLIEFSAKGPENSKSPQDSGTSEYSQSPENSEASENSGTTENGDYSENSEHESDTEGVVEDDPMTTAADPIISVTLVRSVQQGSLPVTLMSIPEIPGRLAPHYGTLAISDKVSLLHHSPTFGAIDQLRLGLRDITHAATLVLRSNNSSSSDADNAMHPASNDDWKDEENFLLGCTSAGSLILVSLEAHRRSTLSVHRLRVEPTAIATHPELPGMVFLAGMEHYDDSYDNPLPSDCRNCFQHLVAMDPLTGKALAGLVPPLDFLEAEENITSIVLFPAANAASLVHAGLQQSGQENEAQRANACDAPEDDDSTHDNSVISWIILGTSRVADPERWRPSPGHTPGRIATCKLIRAVNPGFPAPFSIELCGRGLLRMPGPVTAACAATCCDGFLVFLACRKRLLAYSFDPELEALLKRAWIDTNDQVMSLTPTDGGVLAASDEGASFYAYFASFIERKVHGSDRHSGLHLYLSDSMARKCVSAAQLQSSNFRYVIALDAAGGASLLSEENSVYEQQAHYNLCDAVVKVLPWAADADASRNGEPPASLLVVTRGGGLQQFIMQGFIDRMLKTVNPQDPPGKDITLSILQFVLMPFVGLTAVSPNSKFSYKRFRCTQLRSLSSGEIADQMFRHPPPAQESIGGGSSRDGHDDEVLQYVLGGNRSAQQTENEGEEDLEATGNAMTQLHGLPVNCMIEAEIFQLYLQQEPFIQERMFRNISELIAEKSAAALVYRISSLFNI